MSETNHFKLIVNDNVVHAVDVHEKILARDSEGAVTQAVYTVWYHNEQQGDEFDSCGDAFAHAVEIGLELTSK